MTDNVLFKMFLISTVVLCVKVNLVLSLDILGIFPAPIRSHFFVFETFLQELSVRGHNVTVISYFAEKKSRDDYHVIDLSEKTNITDIELPIQRSWARTLFFMSVIHVVGPPQACRTLLSNENVQNLWTTSRKFDAIVIEQFDSDCALALAHKLGAPVVALTSHMLLPWQYNRLGVPYNPSYVLFDFLEGGTNPSLFQRVQRAICYNWFYFLNKQVTQKLEQTVVTEFLGEIPPLEELGRNIRFLLLYQYFVLSGSSLLPANIKEVGGYHVKEPKPLPDDIRKYIEDSEHGVIYVSFGSIAKSTTLPSRSLEEILKALAEFPQRVIWKWENNTLPGNPNNIFVSKWLPQNDILAHNKVVAFISHCGLLGLTEAIHNAVPVLALPIFGDQPSNAAAAEEAGLGVQLHLNDLTKENLVEKLKVILDPDFKERAEQLSKAWRERPVSAMDSAIFWTEFAARYNYSYRGRLADVPLYQYLCLDTTAILLLIILMFVLSIKFFISLCYKIKAIKTKRE